MTRSILPVFLALLGLLPVRGDQPLAPAETAAVLARIQARRWQLGLDPQNDFQVLGACRDALGQTHVRFQQLFQGVRVYGGEAIDHADAQGAVLDLTDALYRGIQLPVQPSLTPAEALARAEAALAPAGPYAHPPVVELVIWPVRPLRPGLPPFLLAYHVHAQLENGARETRHRDYLIEANTGAILKQWDSLRTEAATGPGLTQYSGTVTLDQDRTAQGYRLLDRTRGRAGAFGGNGITDLAHGTSGNGTLDSNPEPSWGDHANYTGSDLPTTGPTGQTAMADAAFGTQVTWDMYRHVFGRDGIDGKGTATFGRTHYDTSFDNAFWDDTCFCMTYGDGSAFTSVEALDVAGHEMTHGVCSSSANLDYTGEPGGLNEANSDIFGTMAEFYSRGGGYARAARTIPERGGNWTLGEQLASAPLRWMDKPSKDGQSPDAWSDGLGDLDVHFASGPMNRCFYFMSQGASAADGDHHSDDLPSGMAGVGNQRAAQIWYRALTLYLTSQSDYAAARKAALRAATDLYGAAGEETQAVARAFHAIHVGPDWAPVTASIVRPAADLVVVPGTRVAFTGSAEDALPGAVLSYNWSFGDGAVGSGPVVGHTYRNDQPGDAVFTASLRALDDRGNQGADQRTITVTPPIGGHLERIRNGGFEAGSSPWAGDTAVIGRFDSAPPCAGKGNAVFTGIGLPTVQNLYQEVAIPALARAATLTFRLHIDPDPLPGIPLDHFRVQAQSPNGRLLAELAAYSNNDASPGYALKTLDLSAYRGRTMRVNFQASEGWILPTTFALDEVSLVVR